MGQRSGCSVNEVCDRSVNGIVDRHLATFLESADHSAQEAADGSKFCVKAFFSMTR